MKLFVNLKTLEITPYVAGLANKHNGAHEQLEGHVIASFMITGEATQISLLHPDTLQAGHVDVLIIYDNGDVSFRTHGSTKFKLNDQIVGTVFPTGGLSLLLVAIAIEEYLGRLISFRPLLTRKVLTAV